MRCFVNFALTSLFYAALFSSVALEIYSFSGGEPGSSSYFFVVDLWVLWGAFFIGSGGSPFIAEARIQCEAIEEEESTNEA